MESVIGRTESAILCFALSVYPTFHIVGNSHLCHVLWSVWIERVDQIGLRYICRVGILLFDFSKLPVIPRPAVKIDKTMCSMTSWRFMSAKRKFWHSAQCWTKCNMDTPHRRASGRCKTVIKTAVIDEV